MTSELGNLDEFKSVSAISNGIQLTFRDQGGRFNYQIANSERKISVYGESVEIQTGQSAQFVTKGFKITFTPVNGDPGNFKVDKELDLRSMGGELSKKSFSLSVESGSIIFGNAATNP